MKRVMNIVSVVLFVVLGGGAAIMLIWGDDMQAAMVAEGDGHAIIQSARVEADAVGVTLNVTILFNETPPAGDASDVRLSIESPALADQSWSWAELAAKADDPEARGSAAPPIGRPITFQLGVHLLPTVVVREGNVPGAIVRLRWAGTLQHGIQFTMDNIYE